MEINYDYYRIFYYVAKYKSFTQAAHVLLNNQPNITRSMNNLENQLGCQLFVRSNRGVELTPEGERLFSHVSIAYRQLQAAEMELGQNRELQSGSVSVGVSSSAFHEVLLPKLIKFHSLFPGIRLRLVSADKTQAVLLLKKERIDFALSALSEEPEKTESPCRETPLKEFREVLIGSRQCSFLADRPRYPAELSGFPLITLGRSAESFEFYRSFYQSLGFSPVPDIEASSAEQMLSLIQNGLGIGFLSERLAETALSSGCVVRIPLAKEPPARRCSLIEDSSRPLSQPAAQLVNLLLEQEKTE